MTGLLIMSLGSSLRNASQIAGRIIAGSNKERTLRRGLSLVFIDSTSSSPEMFHMKHFCRFSPRFWTKAGFHPPGNVPRRSKEAAGAHREMLLDRPKRQSGEVNKAADDQDHADQKTDEKPAIRREGSSRGWHDLLARQRSGDSQHWDNDQKAADPHREAERRIPERRVGAEPGEGAAIVPGGRNIGVQPFTKALRPGMGEGREAPRNH